MCFQGKLKRSAENVFARRSRVRKKTAKNRLTKTPLSDTMTAPHQRGTSPVAHSSDGTSPAANRHPAYDRSILCRHGDRQWE